MARTYFQLTFSGFPSLEYFNLAVVIRLLKIFFQKYHIFSIICKSQLNDVTLCFKMDFEACFYHICPEQDVVALSQERRDVSVSISEYLFKNVYQITVTEDLYSHKRLSVHSSLFL